MDNLKLSKEQKRALTNIDKHIDEMKDRVNNLNAYLDGTAVDKGLRENFFPRYLDKVKILANRAEFEQRLVEEFTKKTNCVGLGS